MHERVIPEIRCLCEYVLCKVCILCKIPNLLSDEVHEVVLEILFVWKRPRILKRYWEYVFLFVRRDTEESMSLFLFVRRDSDPISMGMFALKTVFQTGKRMAKKSGLLEIGLEIKWRNLFWNTKKEKNLKKTFCSRKVLFSWREIRLRFGNKIAFRSSFKTLLFGASVTSIIVLAHDSEPSLFPSLFYSLPSKLYDCP